MKKSFLILLSVFSLAMFGLTGCGDNKDSSAPPAGQNPQPAAQGQGAGGQQPGA